MHGATRRGSPFRQGLLSNLGNPKMAVFCVSLLPQFGGPFLLLGPVFCTLTLTWLCCYAFVVATAGDVLRRGRVRRARRVRHDDGFESKLNVSATFAF